MKQDLQFDTLLFGLDAVQRLNLGEQIGEDERHFFQHHLARLDL